jgi:serine-type D-Ala-D-Ala carboxypeptidase/endopeptidase (penicillin-binding protein 4)
LLPAPVTQGLAAAKIPAASVAVLVQEVGAVRPRLLHNPGTSMNPASVMKLVTTYAALEMLGPAYRWKTETYLAGTLKGDVLEGDLVLRGSGDPGLDVESFWMLLRALRGKGLREIRGDLLLDRSYFERVNGDAGRFDGDIFRPYNVLPDALLLNYKSVRFSFVADAERNAVRIHAEPRPPTLEVVNSLRLMAGDSCPEGAAFREMLKPLYEPAQQRVTFAGQFPQACSDRDLNVALLEANDHAAGMMRQLWGEIGGRWTGVARDGLAGPAARLFHVHDSEPLAQVVREVNKFSNNVIARQVFLTLGAEAAGAPASSAKSGAAIKAWLAQKGIAAPELVMDNGSGLSRAERISAHTLGALLQAAWKSAVMPEFISSMPIAGVDGTMRRRVKNEGVAGQAHIKTGLLHDVRSLAGYVLDAKGNRVVVVMLVNHPNAHQAQGAMDALLRWAHGG